MAHKLSLTLIALLASFCMVSFSSCGDPAEDDLGSSIDSNYSLYGKYGTYNYSLNGGTLQVGYVVSSNYFEEVDKVKRSKLPNIIIETRGDMADVIIESFVSDNNDCIMSNVIMADMKIDASGTITPVTNLSTITGSYTANGTELAADRVKLNGLKVSGNRIAISEMRIFFGKDGMDCVRFMDIQGVIKQ